MEHIPLYIYLVFILTTALTLWFLYKAFQQSSAILAIGLSWLVVQAIIAFSGFYQKTDAFPPRFIFLVVPPLILILAMFLTPAGRKFIDKANKRWLTLLHVVRVPVEITLLVLFINSQVPQLMTFEGRNFDIFSGVTAPIIVYLAYNKKMLSRNILLIWNLICLALLVNIVTIAILSAPTPFQRLAFNQPNVGVLYFPFVWLPCFIVPAVLFSHLVCIRNLLLLKNRTSQSPTFVPSV